jgi:anaerobic ribonucleoside-triphosphate reductase
MRNSSIKNNIEIEKFYIGLEKNEWLELIKTSKNLEVRWHIMYALGYFKCPKCEYSLLSNNKFCSNCGFSVELFIRRLGYGKLVENKK